MSLPSYLSLHQSGELIRRAESAERAADPCMLCPHSCRAARGSGVHGKCGSPLPATVSSAFSHFGEEPELSGRYGSGTIFFSGCNLRCSFCQNWEISHDSGRGKELEAGELAEIMLRLQSLGCHNINLVSPSHCVHAILETLALAADRGLCLPLVYNCGGYESLDTLRLLDGVVDIYMPDAKFYDDRIAGRFLNASDYGSRAREALREMHSQVGELVCGPDGTAQRGLLIRHLVLPGGLAGTAEWAAWIARELSPKTCVNIMDQYRPCHRAAGDPEIGRAPTEREYREALKQAAAAGLAVNGFGREN